MTKDPTLAIRQHAGQFAGVDEGTACTQSSFKVGGKAFLFIGEQGGRYKAMFKLDKSLEQARELAEASPDDFQVGKTAWVTARFSNERPLPKKIWSKWLKESYLLFVGSKTKPVKKQVAAKKKVVKKKTTKKRAKKAKSRVSKTKKSKK